VTALQKQAAPIDGVGFESHLILNGFSRTIVANFRRFADLGLELAITELDIRIQLPSTSELLSQQAENYAYVVASCLAVEQCIGITTWDTSDDYSWCAPHYHTVNQRALVLTSRRCPPHILGSQVPFRDMAKLFFSIRIRNLNLRTLLWSKLWGKPPSPGYGYLLLMHPPANQLVPLLFRNSKAEKFDTSQKLAGNVVLSRRNILRCAQPTPYQSILPIPRSFIHSFPTIICFTQADPILIHPLN